MGDVRYLLVPREASNPSQDAMELEAADAASDVARTSFLDLPESYHPPSPRRLGLSQINGAFLIQTINILWKNIFLHVTALAYMIFCFVCAFRPIHIGYYLDCLPHLCKSPIV